MVIGGFTVYDCYSSLMHKWLKLGYYNSKVSMVLLSGVR